MKYRIGAMMLATVLCLSIILIGGTGQTLAASDGTDPALQEAFAVLAGLGIVEGYADGGYHPDDPLTRAQFCKLMVTALGQGDKAATSGYRTLFSDLSTGHWAVGYVNLAHELGLISGYGDGTFGPEDPVDLSQGVTMALKALGHTTADIGPFWPGDYLNKAATLGLTDGISRGGTAPLTRGDGALLLYAMLNTENTSGKVFGFTLATTTINLALLMDVEGEGPEGSAHMAQVYANGTVSYYSQERIQPQELEGLRGTLLLNSGGRVMGFLPESNLRQTIAVGEVTATGITARDGKSHSISGSLPVVLKGERTTFEKAWYSMGGLSSAVLYYNASGSADLLWAGSADAGQQAHVVTVSSGQETLLKSIFSVTGTAAVRKNGEVAEYSDIAPYDVVSYDGTSRTFLVSSRKVTGCYENASPNTQAPGTVTMMGAEFPVLDCARESLAKFGVGDRVTLLLTAEGAVAAAYAPSTVQGENIGIYDGTAVTLADGTRLAGTVSGGSGLIGSAVKVSSSAIGKLSLSPASGSSVSGSLKVSAGTVGKYELAPGLVIYDQVSGAAAVQLSLADLKMDSLSSGKISSAVLDRNGRVAYLFLEDATGNCYTYGALAGRTVTGGSEAEGTDYSYQTASVTNSDGAGEAYPYLGTVKSVGGLAILGTGKGVKVISLTQLKVDRSAFITSDGAFHLTADGAVWPVSDEVQVYNTQTKQWVTLEEALAFADHFSVYYDRSAEEGGQVRVIYTQIA